MRGVWQSQTEALFDICVIDTDTQFHAQRSVDAILASAERVKRKYSEAAMARHALFSPFVCMVSRWTNGSRGKSVYEAGGQEAGNEMAKPLPCMIKCVHIRYLLHVIIVKFVMYGMWQYNINVSFHSVSFQWKVRPFYSPSVSFRFILCLAHFWLTAHNYISVHMKTIYCVRAFAEWKDSKGYKEFGATKREFIVIDKWMRRVAPTNGTPAALVLAWMASDSPRWLTLRNRSIQRQSSLSGAELFLGELCNILISFK